MLTFPCRLKPGKNVECSSCLIWNEHDDLNTTTDLCTSGNNEFYPIVIVIHALVFLNPLKFFSPPPHTHTHLGRGERSITKVEHCGQAINEPRTHTFLSKSRPPGHQPSASKTAYGFSLISLRRGGMKDGQERIERRVFATSPSLLHSSLVGGSGEKVQPSDKFTVWLLVSLRVSICSVSKLAKTECSFSLTYVLLTSGVYLSFSWLLCLSPCHWTDQCLLADCVSFSCTKASLCLQTSPMVKESGLC